jgi:hypothetical protein
VIDMAGLNETIRNARLNVIRDAIDAGSGPGTLKVFSGSRPATGGTETTLLGTLTFSATSAPDATGGVLTFNPITEDSSADASGTASWARVEASDGGFVMDVDVGESTSGADVILNTTTIVAGGPIRVTSGTLTEGNA